MSSKIIIFRWLIYANGFKKQSYSGSGTDNGTFTFPVAFKNTNYSVSFDVSEYDSNADIAFCANSYDKTVTNMKIRFQRRGNTGSGINVNLFTYDVEGY